MRAGIFDREIYIYRTESGFEKVGNSNNYYCMPWLDPGRWCGVSSFHLKQKGLIDKDREYRFDKQGEVHATLSCYVPV